MKTYTFKDTSKFFVFGTIVGIIAFYFASQIASWFSYVIFALVENPESLYYASTFILLNIIYYYICRFFSSIFNRWTYKYHYRKIFNRGMIVILFVIYIFVFVFRWYIRAV